MSPLAAIAETTSPLRRGAAFLLALGLLFTTIVAMVQSGGPGPALAPFLPICATLWGAADLLTAFLLFGQFHVTGARTFAVVAGAYAVSGLLTWPYLVFFPGQFESAPTIAAAQVSVWLWIVWHTVFPLTIGIQHLPRVEERRVPYDRTKRIVVIALVALVGSCAAIVFAVMYFSAVLPVLVVDGKFTPLFSHKIAPAIAILNVAACYAVCVHARAASTLRLWLAVALFTSALDAALNAAAPSRYSESWYVGKIETLVTASVVLVMLLGDIVLLYRRLNTLAGTDALTGICNRRTFDDYLRWAIDSASRVNAEIALLMIDVDHFKLYNDAYGHQAGDACLRSVAEVLRVSTPRAADVVARYGGEEFAAILPGTNAEGAYQVARRIQESLREAGIPHEGSITASCVTVSQGVAYVASARGLDADEFVEMADRALYEAKRRRNTIALHSAGAQPAHGPLLAQPEG